VSRKDNAWPVDGRSTITGVCRAVLSSTKARNSSSTIISRMAGEVRMNWRTTRLRRTAWVQHGDVDQPPQAGSTAMSRSILTTVTPLSLAIRSGKR